MFKDTRQLKQWFDESLELFENSRNEARKALEYKEGEQLADSIKMTLRDRGQPEQYENNIEKFDTKIVGFQDTRKTQIGIYGNQKNGHNEKPYEDDTKARILRDVIRATQEDNEFDYQKEASDEDLRFAGVAVQELKVKATGEIDQFGRPIKDVYVENIPSSECFFDPYSKRQDYGDARYFTRAFWTNEESLYAMGFDEKLIKQLTSSNYLDTSLDEDVYEYGSSTPNRYLLCMTWYKKFDKKQKKYRYYVCYWCDSVILRQEESPFKDVPNFEGFPIIVEFTRRKANRTKKIFGYYGIYKHLIPLQDGINQAKLKLFNRFGNVKLLVESDALAEDMDIEIFKDEYSEDDAVIEVEKISGIKEIKMGVEYQQLMNVIADARNQLKEILGFNDELLAIANNRMSGDAIAKRLSTGTFGLADYFKASMRLQKRTIKKMIPLICHFYDATRVVGIVEIDDSRKYFTINEPDLDENGYINYEEVEDGLLAPKMKNKIEVGRYDLVYTEEAKETSSANERFRLNIEMIKELGKYSPDLAMSFAPEAYADFNAPLAERLKGAIDSIKAMQTQGQEQQGNSQLDQMKLAEMAVAIKEKNAKADYYANKNNVDMLRIENQGRAAAQNNIVKREKIVADAVKGAR